MSTGRINTVAVIGTGRMGFSIAAACAQGGFSVRIVSRSTERATAAARELNARQPSHPIVAETLNSERLSDVDLIIETIVEDFEAKADVLRAVESRVPKRTIIATNTSSLSITELKGILRTQERFVGLHFLYPANRTHLVEVITDPGCDAAVRQQCLQFVAHLGKRSISVAADTPGFVWNRLQFALLREALYLLDAGVASAEDIDKAVSIGLAPRWLTAGPLATADLGGVELFAALAERLFPSLSCANVPPESLLTAARGGGLRQLSDTQVDDLRQLRDAVLDRVPAMLEVENGFAKPPSP
jgi:3-hydroxybutyryl-CoA dehydrogenase